VRDRLEGRFEQVSARCRGVPTVLECAQAQVFFSIEMGMPVMALK